MNRSRFCEGDWFVSPSSSLQAAAIERHGFGFGCFERSHYLFERLVQVERRYDFYRRTPSAEAAGTVDGVRGETYGDCARRFEINDRTFQRWLKDGPRGGFGHLIDAYLAIAHKFRMEEP